MENIIVTIDEVRNVAPQLSSLSDEAIQQFIDDAMAFVEADGIPKEPVDIFKRAVRYWTAHLGFAALSSTGGTKKEKVGSLEKEYFGINLQDDPFLQMYLGLKGDSANNLTGRNIAHFYG